MAFANISEVRGFTPEKEEELFKELGLEGRPPRGALMRLRGPIEGARRVISVWESREAFEEFRERTLEPAFRKLGLDLPTFEAWNLRDITVTPAAREGITTGAVAMIGQVPGGEREEQEVMTAMGVEQNRPSGIYARMSGATRSGYQVLSIWESRQAAEDFRRTRLEPALQRLGKERANIAELWTLDDLMVSPAARQAAGVRG